MNKNFIKKLASFDGTSHLRRVIAKMESASLKIEKGALMFTDPKLKTLQKMAEVVLVRDYDVPETFIENRVARDGEECHITILNSKDISEIIKSRLDAKKSENPGLPRKDIENLIKGDILSEANESFKNDWECIGLGSAEKDGAKCYYIILSFPSGDMIRESLGLGRKDFHVTVGFDPKDIHDVSKGAETKIADI